MAMVLTSSPVAGVETAIVWAPRLATQIVPFTARCRQRLRWQAFGGDYKPDMCVQSDLGVSWLPLLQASLSASCVFSR